MQPICNSLPVYGPGMAGATAALVVVVVIHCHPMSHLKCRTGRDETRTIVKLASHF